MGLSSEQVIGDRLECSQECGLEIPRIAGEADSQHQQREKVAPLPCPRCDSKNTKFCYYNNYSKLQPRHFCKACRRYWTAGGVLRDVPVGGSRKNKRLKTAHDDDTNSCSSTTIAAGQHQQPPARLLMHACPEEILHETLHRTPPQLKLPFAPVCGALDASSYVESAPSTALLLPEYLAWEEEPAGILSYRFEDMFDPFSSSISSSSCSSPLDDCARRDSGLIAVNGGASSWQKDHAGSYLSCWDEVFDIVDLELKLPGSEQKI